MRENGKIYSMSRSGFGKLEARISFEIINKQPNFFPFEDSLSKTNWLGICFHTLVSKAFVKLFCEGYS